MKKRILSFILALSILSGLMVALPITASAATSGVCGENLTWTLDDGTLTISGTGDMYNYYHSLSQSPWYTSMASVKNVIINDGVTSIGKYAFYNCRFLMNVTIGNNVTSIADSAFYGCSSLINARLGNRVRTIGKQVFSGCVDLTNITIPDSVITIGDSAFSSCYSLTSVTIGNSVTSIGEGAFSSCSSLISFDVDVTNMYYCSPNGVLYNNDKTNLIKYPAESNMENYVIPDSVTLINAGAFSSCSNLTSVTIPDSVTTIYEDTFSFCYNLTSITIPDSVTIISDNAFEYCENLRNVVIGNGVTTIGIGAFEKSGLTDVTLGNSVTTIKSSAFEYCDGLRNITIPDSVTTIGDRAFFSCISLKNITIPDGVTTIGDSAFDSCSGLINVIIGNGVSKMGAGVFSSCDRLTSVTFPDSVTTISTRMFSYCETLASITIPDSVTTIGYDAFYHCKSLADVYYTGSEPEWNNIGISSGNNSLKSAIIHYNYIEHSTEKGQYIYTSTEILNDGKTSEVSTTDITSNNYPKHTTVRPKTTNNSANLVGDWEVKNTTVETGEINSGVTISLSGDLIVENGVFKVTKGTTMNAASLKVGTNGQVIVDGTLNIDGDILLYGGSSKVSGGYLELNRSNSLFDVAVTTCGSLKLSDYGHITVNGRFDINGDMTIATQSTASNYTNQGSIWLRGNLTQKKDGLFAPGNTFCPKEKFKLILNQNISSAVHKLKFDSPKKSYINDLYIVKGSYDNFYDGNAEINGLVKRIIEANNDKGYVFENVTADFKKEQNKWNTAFNELFNTISSKTAGYVDLATNQSYFKQEFGEDTYNALRAYFGVLCLSMQIDPPSSFGYVGIKDSIPHYVKFYNSAKEKWVNGKFIVDAIDLAEISGTRTISYKCSDGETRIFCVLMYGNIEPLGNQLMELVSSNYADYYTGILGTTLNAFNKEPQKYIAKLLWEGVAHTKIPGLKDLSKSTIQDFISSQSFQNFVVETCNYNPSRMLLLSIDDKQELSATSLFSDDTHSNVIANSTLLLGTEKGIFTDDAFETAVREKLGLSDDEEITEAMLADITSLSLPEKNIVSIKGIEYMTSLRKLDLSGNAITDISYISELSELTEINLNGNNIYDISALEKLSSLKKLMINSNYISDLTPIVSLTALQVLDIGNNLINDISSIENLVNIKQLNVAYNSITSLNALYKMTSLKVLYAHNNSICDISNVANCPLIDVNLSNNSITDISAFEDSGIVELDLSNNPISDVSALNGNISLATLILEGTSVDDDTVDVIATLTGIKKLSVQNTVITDISAFSTLTSLEELSVANTYVSDLSALEGIYWLKKLDISDNNISNLSFISSLTNMKELYADNCLITDSDLEELSNLTSLTILSLSSNCISDIDFVNTLTRLTYLDLSNNANINKQSIEEKRELFENKGNTFIYTLANIAVTNIFMDSAEKTIDFGSRVTDFAHIYPYNASKNDVIYFSSDNTVVTYENNVLTAVSEGKATVTAQNTEGDIIATCDIIVKLGAIKAIIKSAEINDNEFTAEIESFSSEDMENISIILGIYGDNNEFKKAKQLRTDIAAKSSLVYTIEDISIEDDCDYYKVFVWNSELCPLADVFMGELQKSFAVDDVLESKHPYDINTDETKTYTYNGECTSIDVTFSNDTITENGWDFIYIYDANDNEIGVYTGTELAGQTINVQGNTIKIRLTSDSIITENGYRTESIIVNK